MIAVTEISFTDWFSSWDRWLMNRASTPSEGLDVPCVDARRESDRRKAEWATSQHGRERRYTAERRMIEVREVGLDQWLCSIDSNLHRWSPRFVKHSINDVKKVEIAAIDPDFGSRPQPLVPDGIR